MSRQYDAKQVTLEAYPEPCDEAIDLFLGYLDISESDFIYEEGKTPEVYIYGDAARPVPPQQS